MAHRNLHDMITYLQYGTKLHIGVLFFGRFGNPMCELPQKHKIHDGAMCQNFKTSEKDSYHLCYECREKAIRKALSGKKPFGGICINGIYEYTHPVIIGTEVACIIYIGNIFPEANPSRLLQKLDGKKELLDSMEKNFGEEKCRIVAELLEGHIRTLLEEYRVSEPDTMPLIENIKSYMESNLEFNIDVSNIASFFHYNKLYLGRIFKKETGLTIHEYINKVRLEKAKLLLENTKSAVIDIATGVGFNNVTYFNRIFKKMTGHTPTEYRGIKAFTKEW